MSENQNSNQKTDAIESLQQSYSNIKIFTAVPMGVLLIVYFFSFAMLIDRGMHGMLMFEIITSVLIVFYYIFINRAAFAILKILYKNKSPYNDLLSLMQVTEVNMKPDALLQIIESRR